MKHWYHFFYFLYKNNPFLKRLGVWFISTKEERIIQRRCRNQKKILRKKTEKGYVNIKNEGRDIAVVAIIKDEGLYIEEWIEYHLMVGVNKFIIYDHDSSDNTERILQPYIEKKIIYYYKVSTPGSRIHHPQEEMYTDAIFNFRDVFQWMFFLDVDEFVVLERGDKLINVINEIVSIAQKKGIEKVAGIGINWLVYGSNNYKTRPNGLVIENYTRRAKDDYYANRTIKSVVNPKCVIGGGIHRPQLVQGYVLVNENGNIIEGNEVDNSHRLIRINHYASKSLEEQTVRLEKGFGGSRIKHLSHDKNDIEDYIMGKYVNFLKDKLNY